MIGIKPTSHIFEFFWILKSRSVVGYQRFRGTMVSEDVGNMDL